MSGFADEDERLRSAALQNAQSIQQSRQRAEQELRRTKEALEEETRVLDLLNKTGATLASNLELEVVVQAVTDAATKAAGAQFGAFFYSMTKPDGAIFTLYTLSGAPREAFERFGHPRSTPVFAPTFKGEAVVRVDDIMQDERYGKMGPHHGMPAGHLPVRSYLAVPVISRTGKVLGGLFFGHPEPGVFTERSERLTVGIAAQAAIAIDNAQLYEQARRDAEERAQLLEAERCARLEVERAALIKDEFLATLSHELRTPLTAILGWAQLLLNKAEQGSALRAGLEKITRNARAQSQLINDLLDMNRIISGKMRLDVQQVDVSVVVDAALDSVLPSADAKGIQVRKTVDPLAGLLIGDPDRLQQVIWNLLTNAVKFTPKDGRVDVGVRRVNSHIEVSVQDSGVGIALEFAPHVFERFRQADSSSTRKFGGLGLGLSIVKKLVELHGGTVRAESGGEGTGSTFVVSLPIRAASTAVVSSEEHPARAPHTPGPRGPSVSLAGTCVVVVDDEGDARDLITAVLEEAGAEVIAAASAKEGLELVKARRPDIIVSDIGMPDRDGYEFVRSVRALDPAHGGKTPAIALTAFARSEDRTRAMLAGYQAHIAKPIEQDELVATVRSLVDNSGGASPG